MLENTFLNLSGLGYLHDVQSEPGGECYATLNMIHQFNGSQFEDLWVKCQFNREQFPIFSKLAHYLDENKTVLLKFDAKYSGFQQCYAGLSENDPRFIVYLHGELLNVYEYDVEGVRTLCRHNQPIQDHNMLHKHSA